MLKSSNLESIIEAVGAAASPVSDTPLAISNNNNNSSNSSSSHTANSATIETSPSTRSTDVANNNAVSGDISRSTLSESASGCSMASLQLSAGLLQIFEPPLVKARGQLKELIGKQNKIYIDLSTEKFKLDNAEIAKLQEMMNNVKIYREKLLKIKKQMQSIYQRTKVLKKRAINVHTCKQKELQRKLQKQQQEESLIGKRQEQQQRNLNE